jgi:hypothetical protein
LPFLPLAPPAVEVVFEDPEVAAAVLLAAAFPAAAPFPDLPPFPFLAVAVDMGGIAAAAPVAK